MTSVASPSPARAAARSTARNEVSEPSVPTTIVRYPPICPHLSTGRSVSDPSGGLRRLPSGGWEGGEREGSGERGRDCLVALVLGRVGQPGPVEGLLLVVAGEHAEADRNAGAMRDEDQSGGRGLAHIVEMRGATADDHAEGDDGVDPAAGDDPRGR